MIATISINVVAVIIIIILVSASHIDAVRMTTAAHNTHEVTLRFKKTLKKPLEAANLSRSVTMLAWPWYTA